MYEMQNNGQVLKVEQESETMIKTHYCMAKQVTLTLESANTIRARVRDWEGKFLAFEPVMVSLSGDEVQQQEFTCTDGLIELTGNVGAVVTVRASLAGADSAELVVTLQ